MNNNVFLYLLEAKIIIQRPKRQLLHKWIVDNNCAYVYNNHMMQMRILKSNNRIMRMRLLLITVSVCSFSSQVYEIKNNFDFFMLLVYASSEAAIAGAVDIIVPGSFTIICSNLREFGYMIMRDHL
jgi:hypothetical protein